MPTENEQKVVSCLLRDIRSPVILDCGAHNGEEEGWFREACSETLHYVMVEPDPRNCQVILDRAPTSPIRRLVIGAVSDTNGVAEFYFSENSVNLDHGSGSLLEPTGHLEHIKHISFPFRGMVPTYTLDTIFEKEWLQKVDLLWVDVQGAERKLIAGGAKTLAKTRYIFMEKEHVELFRGEALRDELVSLLKDFRVLREFEQNILFVSNSVDTSNVTLL